MLKTDVLHNILVETDTFYFQDLQMNKVQKNRFCNIINVFNVTFDLYLYLYV